MRCSRERVEAKNLFRTVADCFVSSGSWASEAEINERHLRGMRAGGALS